MINKKERKEGRDIVNEKKKIKRKEEKDMLREKKQKRKG